METDEQFSIGPSKEWTFITHHAQVLLAVARDPDVRVATIAGAVGISERYTYRILSDLQRAGYVRRVRNGRHNHYRINPDLSLGDPVLEDQSLRDLLRLIDRSDGPDLHVALAPRRPSS